MMLILNDFKDKPNNPIYFVHIPKNGGASINQQITSHRPQRIVSCGHAHPIVIGPKFGYDKVNHVRFAVFRDPFDHLVSLAAYAKSQYPLVKDLLARFSWMTNPDFNSNKVGFMRQFLEQIQREIQQPAWIDIFTARQQIAMLKAVNVDRKILDQNKSEIVDWRPGGHRGMYMWKVLDNLGLGFSVDGDWYVDIVLRFDKLQAELSAFCKLMSITDIQLVRYNVTPREKTDIYYDEYNSRLVQDMFAEDIAFWDRLCGE